MERFQKERRKFKKHLALYAVASMIFAGISILKKPEHVWLTWAMSLWGVLVVAHGLYAYLFLREKKEKKKR